MNSPYMSFRRYLWKPESITMLCILISLSILGLLGLIFIRDWSVNIICTVMVLPLVFVYPVLRADYNRSKHWHENSKLFVVEWYDKSGHIMAQFRHIRALDKEEASQWYRCLSPSPHLLGCCRRNSLTNTV